jgi:UDP-N-acetylglucosamine 2-epimerase (non-hydrolysing)
MIDTLLSRLPAARAAGLPLPGLQPGGYVTATLHRPSNVDSASALGTCLEALARIAERETVVLPLHPRTRQRAEDFGMQPLLNRLHTTPPLGYLDMLALVDGAGVVLTDSGGLQEETTALGVPCVTLREQTERPVTIHQGTNRLAPWPLSVNGIMAAYEEARHERRRQPGERCPDGWDGRAAARTVDALEQ